jgi:hypothetical protein
MKDTIPHAAMADAAWVRRPHPRRATQRCVGPSCIFIVILAPHVWGWPMLYEPVSLAVSHQTLIAMIVFSHALSIGAMYCLRTLLSREPTSTSAWRALHPAAQCSPCRVCHQLRPEDTHHCRTCDACIVMHDHHCSVLGVCIGHGNRCTFIALLLIGSCAYFGLARLCALAIHHPVHNQSLGAYAAARGVAIIVALLLGSFGALQLVLLATGLTLKSPRLLPTLCRRLRICGRGPTAEEIQLKSTSGEGTLNDEDDVMAEPGCCACIQANHDAGLDGILPGVGTLTTTIIARGADADERANLLRYAATAAAAIEAAIACYLLWHEAALPIIPWVAPLVVGATAWASVVGHHLMRDFQLATSKNAPPTPRFFPPSARLEPQPPSGDGATGTAAREPCATLADDDTEEDGWQSDPHASEHRPLTKSLHKSHPDDDDDDDGLIEQMTMTDDASSGAAAGRGGVAWCAACRAYVRRPSAHCRACNRCILLMDHHCSLLRTCIGSSNRQAYCQLLIIAIAVSTAHLAAALQALPSACARVVSAAAPLFAPADPTNSGGPLATIKLSAYALRADMGGVTRCAPAAGLAAIGVYSVVVLGSFLAQQLAFVALVQHGLPAPQHTAACSTAADKPLPWRGHTKNALYQSDVRLWLLRRVVCITYWRRQRMQLLSSRTSRGDP